jgi:hypothetical protein
MKRFMDFAPAALLLSSFLLIHELNARGFGGGGARIGGGGIGGGGFSGGGMHTGGVIGPYGGSGINQRVGGTVVGPAGGSASRGYQGGSYTTKGGSNINYGVAGKGATGPFGGSAGRYVGGVQVTTPGGQEFGKVSTGKGAVGPGGNAFGTRSSIGGTTGPYGSGIGVSHGAAGIGPGGAFGAKYQGGVAVGPYGGVAAGSKGGVIGTGPAGNVYGGGYRVGATPRGTFYMSGTAIHTQAGYVRTGFRHYGSFTPAWYAQYPGAWRAARWTAASVWTAAAWNSVYAYCGYPAQPIYYDYGDNVVYQDNNVYYNGKQVYTGEQYTQQAAAVADTGAKAQPAPDDEWQPLGVFGMVEEGAQASYDIFQLAINKEGIIRGNYYNARTDQTEPLKGAVDKKSQRAAWTIGDRKLPVYEAGIANLTKSETTMLVHFSDDRTQQFALVRLEQPDGEKK